MRRSNIEREVRLQDAYRLLGKIGEGTYGNVYKAEPLKKDPEAEETPQLAVKIVKSHKEGKNDVVLSMATLREIKLLRELKHHENVVNLHDVHVDPKEKSLALVFEYAEHDLRQIIQHSKQSGQRLSEYTIKSLIWQILRGTKYMHDNWVLHRDMKPQNILVIGHGRRRGCVKLADFGLARIYQSPFKALSDVERVVVTLWYRAPELLLGAKHYTAAVDMWAVGCIFAEILNQRELFCGKEVEGRDGPFQKDQCDKIFRVLGLPTPHTWKGLEKLPEYKHIEKWAEERAYPSISILKDVVHVGGGQRGERLLDLLSRMLECDPEKRITAAEALQHPYMTEQEPRPQIYAFDEPDRPPISFPVNQPVPLPDSQHHHQQSNHNKRPAPAAEAYHQNKRHRPENRDGRYHQQRR